MTALTIMSSSTIYKIFLQGFRLQTYRGNLTEQSQNEDDYVPFGTVLDNKLSFQEHTNIISRKAHHRLFLLRKLRNFSVGVSVLKAVYCSLIKNTHI